MFVSAADQPLNEAETRFALAVVELQVRAIQQAVIGGKLGPESRMKVLPHYQESIGPHISCVCLLAVLGIVFLH